MFSWKGIWQNSKKSKSGKSYFSTFRKYKSPALTFRLFEIHKDTFSLFDFLPFDFSKLILHTFSLEPAQIPPLLRRRECRTAMPRPGGLWAPGRTLELTLLVGSAGVGLKAIEWGPAASEISSYAFLNIFMELWNCGFLGASGEYLFPKAPAKGFS